MSNWSENQFERIMSATGVQFKRDDNGQFRLYFEDDRDGVVVTVNGGVRGRDLGYVYFHDPAEFDRFGPADIV